MWTQVIVMDSFSDVNLLCDLLESSRNRNVCVHLLLDHLNLNVFTSMWEDLKLNSKHFPVSLSAACIAPSFSFVTVNKNAHNLVLCNIIRLHQNYIHIYITV